ncbi:1445_t:CDS:2 [Diversispora eburnea]|uniref:1445_t:CDS:1 n=1 Tax=Diversispora eburnea TaxID=1213867 RepID=A0A9N8YNH9_9GLOM|nr:1445_t:CDS:2 [Diversispora eburnea]
MYKFSAQTSPTLSERTINSVAHSTRTVDPIPEQTVVLSRADIRASFEAYEQLLGSAKLYRNQMIALAQASAGFGQALERMARCKGALESGPALQAAAGLHYLMSNHQQVLSDAFYKKFEIPLLENLDNHKVNVLTAEENYDRSLAEMSKRIKETEAENLRSGRKHLTQQVEDLDRLKTEYYRQTLETEKNNLKYIFSKVSTVVRAEVDIYERISIKGMSDPILEGMITQGPDPFCAYPTAEQSSEIFSVLPPVPIINPIPELNSVTTLSEVSTEDAYNISSKGRSPLSTLDDDKEVIISNRHSCENSQDNEEYDKFDSEKSGSDTSSIGKHFNPSINPGFHISDDSELLHDKDFAYGVEDSGFEGSLTSNYGKSDETKELIYPKSQNEFTEGTTTTNNNSNSRTIYEIQEQLNSSNMVQRFQIAETNGFAFQTFDNNILGNSLPDDWQQQLYANDDMCGLVNDTNFSANVFVDDLMSSNFVDEGSSWILDQNTESSLQLNQQDEIQQVHTPLSNSSSDTDSEQNNESNISSNLNEQNRAQTPGPLQKSNIPNYLTIRRRSLSADNIHALAKSQQLVNNRKMIYPIQQHSEQISFDRTIPPAIQIQLLKQEASRFKVKLDKRTQRSMPNIQLAAVAHGAILQSKTNQNGGSGGVPIMDISSSSLSTPSTPTFPNEKPPNVAKQTLNPPRRGHTRKRSLSAPTTPFQNLTHHIPGSVPLQPAQSIPLNFSMASYARRPNALPIQIQRNPKHSHSTTIMSSEEYQRKLDEELEKVDFEDITTSRRSGIC